MSLYIAIEKTWAEASKHVYSNPEETTRMFCLSVCLPAVEYVWKSTAVATDGWCGTQLKTQTQT